MGADALGEVHQQVLERQGDNFDALGGRERSGLGQDHLDPFFQREERSLVPVDGDADHQLVHQLHRATDDVEVAVRDGIEGPGIESDAHGP